MPPSSGPPRATASTSAYLRALGDVFKACRGPRSVTEIAHVTKGRVSRATIDHLERGVPNVNQRNQIELAEFYGLTLTELHRRAVERVTGPPPPGDQAGGGTLTLTFSREEREAVLRALVKSEPPSGPKGGR